MRCLALAQHWLDSGGQATFMMAGCPDAFARRFEQEGIELVEEVVTPGSFEDAARLASAAHERDAGWVVVDGYAFGPEYRDRVRAADLRLLIIDDLGGNDSYDVDIVLNQNVHATRDLYVNRLPHTRLLLGTAYSLLRREFLRWRERPRETRPLAEHVLLTFGGSDPMGLTARVLKILVGVEPGLKITAVVGPGCLQQGEPEAVDAAGVRVERGVEDMSGLMRECDVAIAAAGSTCWELAFMGVPALVVATSENQLPIAAAIESTGMGMNLGSYDDLGEGRIVEGLLPLLRDASRRDEMSQRGRTLVDGMGARRVVEAMIGGEA